MKNFTKQKIAFIVSVSLLLTLLLVLTFIHNNVSQSQESKNSKTQLNSNVSSVKLNKSTDNKTATTAVTPKKPLNVWVLGDSPFLSNKYVTFHTTSAENLENLKSNSFIIASKGFMNSKNHNTFIQLAKDHYTILIYDQNLTAEEVVSYFNGLFPVVPLDASQPLKYQAYGVTTLNGQLIPIFVSVTNEQTSLNEDSFDQLFSLVSQKTKNS